MFNFHLTKSKDIKDSSRNMEIERLTLEIMMLTGFLCLYVLYMQLL